MRLSVIMPTVGRETLFAAIRSVVSQLVAGDEVIVVEDTAHATGPPRLWFNHSFDDVRRVHVGHKLEGSVFGNAQRDHAMTIARGTHLLFLDDDDVYVPGALRTVRRAVGAAPGKANIFRAAWGPGHHAHGVELWADPVVRESNVATPMVVLPNRVYEASWMGSNGLGVVSDFGFLSAAIEELMYPPVWHPEVIATVRPCQQGC